MFSLSVLVFSLLPIANALLAPKSLDTDTNSLAPNASGTPSASLGPVSQLHIVNEYIAPDGFNRS